MKTFKLPDLGEGLPDAIIREWYVKVGDSVEVDQLLVSMETAKALVDVPSPEAGKIEKLFGEPDDTIETGQPLIGFEGEEEAEEEVKDTGTVVGAIEESNAVLEESAVGVTAARTAATRVKATPAIRALAKKLDVNLADITPKGSRITAEDVEAAAKGGVDKADLEDMETLSPVRRAMVLSMTQSHQQVVPVTLSDDADIHAWPKGENVTMRLIRAVSHACQAVPILNATFDGKNSAYRLNDAVNLGIAIDTEHGLYVPVLKDIANQSDKQLREKLELLKTQAQEKSIHQEDLHGATIVLSNFGTFAGRYASPIIVPPTVAIIGVGRIRDAVVAAEGKPAVHRIMPLSVTVDHRIVTGGESARFLKVLIDALSQ